MAAAGSDSQLLPLGKLWFSKDLCFKHCEVVKKITIFIRLLTLKQKMGKRSHVVLKSCCLLVTHTRAEIPPDCQINFKRKI